MGAWAFVVVLFGGVYLDALGGVKDKHLGEQVQGLCVDTRENGAVTTQEGWMGE